MHTIYPTAVTVYNTASYQAVGQFNVADRSSLEDVDASGRDLFVSFNGVYYGVTNTVVYATGVSVPEPSTFVLIAAGVLGIAAYTWRKRSCTREEFMKRCTRSLLIMFVLCLGFSGRAVVAGNLYTCAFQTDSILRRRR